MKSIVIYYSQTGNTKKMAQAIHKGMSEVEGQVDIAKLQDVDPTKDLGGYDLIGLGSPVQCIKELPNVTEFIETMRSVEGKHGFAFSTHGALPGRYMARVVPAMEQRGLTIIGWNDWFCSVMFPLTPKPYFTDGHPDEIDLKEAEDFGRQMVNSSRRIYQGETNLIRPLPKGKEYDDWYEVVPGPTPGEFAPFLRVQDSMEFKVNKEKCGYPKCMVCIDNCPAHAIDFTVDPPKFTLSCARCWHCEQTCPRGAIELDWLPLQLLHDPMTVNWLQKSLEVYEARGRFRRLAPISEIGWDTAVWTLKRPRYKLP